MLTSVAYRYVRPAADLRPPFSTLHMWLLSPPYIAAAAAALVCTHSTFPVDGSISTIAFMRFFAPFLAAFLKLFT